MMRESSKINDTLGFKDKKTSSSGRGFNLGKGKDNMEVHVETIKSQQFHVKSPNNFLFFFVIKNVLITRFFIT